MKTIIISIVSLGLVATLYSHPYLLLLALVVVAGGWLYMLHDRRYLYVFGVAGFAGPIAEVIAIYAGAWQYTLPQYAEIPVWLPILWGLAGMFIVRVWLRADAT